MSKGLWVQELLAAFVCKAGDAVGWTAAGTMATSGSRARAATADWRSRWRLRRTCRKSPGRRTRLRPM
jgi:hypothetical protein